MVPNVVICEDLPEKLQAVLSELTYNKLFVLTDQHTHQACWPAIQSLPVMKEAGIITLPAGDVNKNTEQLGVIWQRLSEGGAGRDSILLNLGGGMITDIGGFAGATFKRGIRTINIPTTLMASVDAAVGGKTGINFNGLKNEVGAFHDPLCVLIDCRFLATLDRHNLLSGYAEMIKHGLIGGPDVCASVLGYHWDTAPNYTLLNQMVAASVAVKERIVTEDPLETGLRKALNFGHTVGHAFESLSFWKGTPLLHGHAVAAGMVAELYLSHKLCGFPLERLSRTVHYIRTYYPATLRFDCKDYEALYQYMTHDKKNQAGVICFTLLADVGDVRINQTVSRNRIEESLDFYRESFGV